MKIQVPEKILSNPLFSYLIEPLQSEDGSIWQGALQKIVDDTFATSSDIRKKWWGATDLPDTNVMELVIRELGYGYILDILLIPDNSSITRIYIYISLIHYLKGTRKGIELVFTLLDLNYSIEEWWETSNRDEDPALYSKAPYTFKLSLKPRTSVEISISALRTFCQNYVYPLMIYVENLDCHHVLINAGMAYIDRIVYGYVINDIVDATQVIFAGDEESGFDEFEFNFSGTDIIFNTAPVPSVITQLPILFNSGSFGFQFESIEGFIFRTI
jgi:hypothetical protein